MSETKPKVGDKLHLVDCGNNARRGTPRVHRECVVTKVGRKYFDVEYDGDTKWPRKVNLRLDDMKQNTDYTASFRAYPTKQGYLDEVEAEAWRSKLTEMFTSWGKLHIPVEKYRQVGEILGLVIEESGE